ncbi:carbamate kinase [Actinomadura gamaensis]|uniref:Carbamate kinase n=1 Tax=Actinomadura gamaensis TaxID=1763541 RepID=A0ABV9U231_9ACTN
MRLVIALGGNALLRRTERPDARIQASHVREAVSSLAPLLDAHEVLVAHGNGPQVGLLAVESAEDPQLAEPYPLDVLGAETQGMIGYWLVRELRHARPRREVAGLLTEIVVDADDPAFDRPTKFVGRGYGERDAAGLRDERGWTLCPDGSAWRRVVPSPEPRDVPELPTLRRLLGDGCVVVAAGGGGTPVVMTPDGPSGVEAVVDKDLTAALLAERLDADALLMLTDVSAVMRGFGTPRAAPVRRATPAELRALDLPAGSMAPKAEAACRFAEHRPGAFAAIGALSDAVALVDGRAGTRVQAKFD